MLRNLGIRSKILATLSIPVLLLLVVAGVLVKDAIDQRNVAKSYASVLDASTDFSDVVHAVQAERTLSMAVLAGDATKQPMLKQTRAGITEGLTKLERTGIIGGNDTTANTGAASKEVVGIWDQVRAFQASLDQIRKRIDAKQMTAAQVNTAYSTAVNGLLTIPSALGQELPLLSMQKVLVTITANERANEALMRERDALTPILTLGGYSSAAEQQAARIAIMRRIVAGEVATANARALEGDLKTSTQLSAIEDKLLALPVKRAPNVSVAQLNAAADTQSNELRSFQNQRRDVAQQDVDGVINDASQRLTWTILGSLLVLASMVLLGLYMSRSISAPLRRLSGAVDRVHTKLPEIVNRDNPDHKITLTDDMIVPIEADDEIGQLASSFNDVNRAVVDTANAQAELRASIAAMFVNVARRDQTLLSRQLSLIDQLERTEEDPQTLSTLFKLDHLSTRMRRNAEALLVLAGIDTGRRLRRAMALSDVVRTASSEIEHYDRVDLVQTVDPQMLGHTALSAASMLAELLENATAFSDPNSRVSVRTENSPNGVAVIITDEGLGMSQTEVDEANNKIQSVSLAEVVASKRIGFFVVGRLARRLESLVVVSRAAGKGTMVRVEFPPQVFLPGAVTHVKPAGAGDAETRQLSARPTPAPATPDVGPMVAPATSPKALATGIGTGAAADPARRDTATPSRQATPTAKPAEATPTARQVEVNRTAKQAKPTTQTARPAPAPRTKPDAEERLSRATKPLGQRTPKPVDEAAAGSVAPASQRETKSDPARKVESESSTKGRPAPAPKPAEAVKSAPAPKSAETTKAAAGPVPEPRIEDRPPRGGLFSSFRRTRDEATENSSATAPADAQPAKATQTPAPAATEEARAPQSVKPEPAKPASKSASPRAPKSSGAPAPEAPPAPTAGELPTRTREAVTEQPASPQAPKPVPTGGGSRDILPSSGRKPQPARGGGSLFSRLGESGGQPASAAQAPASTDAQAATPPPAAEPTVPSRRVPDDAPVQPAAPAARDVSSSDFAAEALSELGRLQAYRPSTMATGGSSLTSASTLVRRQAGATPAGQLPPPKPQPSASRRGRSAADVRSMLSGFQAGVERGRTTTDSQPDEASE